MEQLRLPLSVCDLRPAEESYRDRLIWLLSQNLNFHDQRGNYASHSLHAFPAKFPPQLPRLFIAALTRPGDSVLDPMVGSGTTIIEALLAERQGIGFDIDPLARLIATVKTTPLQTDLVMHHGKHVISQAKILFKTRRSELEAQLQSRWTDESRTFIDYWFAPGTQVELLALLIEIEKINNPHIRAFFELTFSSIIITKSGGVSLALDLAHTRPHRARFVIAKDGQVIIGHDRTGGARQRDNILTRTVRSALDEFEKRFWQNVKGLAALEAQAGRATIHAGNAQHLPLADASIDLIFTSPPYAANAIDYMRAHKFSLVWLGHTIPDLGHRRKQYIGGETITDMIFETLPPDTMRIVETIARYDLKKGKVLHRYYSEMTGVLREMFRVLRSDRAAIIVVGSSVMRGQDTQTPECLAEIGRCIGFDVPRIGVRQLDRDRRMLPTGTVRNHDSQIQQRMHEEYVIGFYKP